MKRKRKMLAMVAGATLLAASPNLYAQKELEEAVGKAEVAARKGDWATAYPFYKTSTELANVEKFGAKVGYLWYRRGQAAQNIAKAAMRKRQPEVAGPLFQDAISAYQKCNGIGPADENPYKNAVMLRKGQCEQAIEQYEEALKSYAKFQADFNRKNKYEKFNMASYRLDRALCLFKLDTPKVGRGAVDFEWVMEHKVKYKVPEALIVKCFQAYCGAIAKKAEAAKDNKSEIADLEKEIIAFIQKNRAALILRPFQMYVYTPVFLQQVMTYRELGMDKASFALMSFLPNTKVSKEDMEMVLDDIGDREGVVDGTDILYTDQIKKSVEILNRNASYAPIAGKEGKKHEPHEMVQNLLMAKYYEDEGNSRAAFAIYEMIELYHSDHPKREDWLFHLVRTSYNIGEIFKTTEYGQRYLKDYPKGQYVAEVEKFMLITLFQNRKYEECIKIAGKLLNGPLKGKEGEKQHDIALYCLGGSHFYLGQPIEAGPQLTKHVELYGKGGKHELSDFACPAQWMEASNDTYLQLFDKALPKLTKFLEKDYPNPNENPYYPFAKYDRANCYTNLDYIDGNYDKAIEDLNPVIDSYRDSGILDKAYALRGNNWQNKDELKKAHDDYVAGLAVSQKAKNEAVEQEILNYLVGLLASPTQPMKTAEEKAAVASNYKEAVKYYDIFWQKYANDSPYKAQVATSGIPALRDNGRGKEGLANLKQVIEQLANVEGAAGMAKAINSYTDYYLEEEGNNPAMLKEHYKKDFPFRSDQIRALSLVKMSLVGVYQELAKLAKKDPTEVEHWNNQIKAELDAMSAWDITKLNNYTLVSIGSSILENASDDFTAGQASRFFEQVFANKKNNVDSSNYNEALFIQAQVLMRSRNEAQAKSAYTQLKELFEKSDTAKDKQKALYAMINISSALEDHDVVVRDAKKFLKDFGRSRNKTAVRHSLMTSAIAKGDRQEAYNQAVSIGAKAGAFQYSCDAILFLIDYAEAKSKYEAWVTANSFVKSTQDTKKKNESKIPAPILEKWEQIAERAEALANDPSVKAEIKRKEEIEKAKKNYN